MQLWPLFSVYVYCCLRYDFDLTSFFDGWLNILCAVHRSPTFESVRESEDNRSTSTRKILKYLFINEGNNEDWHEASKIECCWWWICFNKNWESNWRRKQVKTNTTKEQMNSSSQEKCDESKIANELKNELPHEISRLPISPRLKILTRYYDIYYYLGLYFINNATQILSYTIHSIDWFFLFVCLLYRCLWQTTTRSISLYESEPVLLSLLHVCFCDPVTNSFGFIQIVCRWYCPNSCSLTRKSESDQSEFQCQSAKCIARTSAEKKKKKW